MTVKERIIDELQRAPAGEPYSEIAARLGLPRQYVAQIAKLCGYPMRRPGRQPFSKPVPGSRVRYATAVERRAAIVAMLRDQSHLNYRQIGGAAGCTRERVRQIAREEGYQPRQSGPPVGSVPVPGRRAARPTISINRYQYAAIAAAAKRLGLAVSAVVEHVVAIETPPLGVEVVAVEVPAELAQRLLESAYRARLNVVDMLDQILAIEEDPCRR